MRIINEAQCKQVSGGWTISTSDILDFFRPKSTEPVKWENPIKFDSRPLGNGGFYGALFFGIAATAAAVVIGAGSLILDAASNKK